MPATVTLKRTQALSVSTNLPEGIETYRQGLIIPKDLPYDEWIKLGSRLTEVTGAAMWMIGDWLAYGQAHYLDSHWGKRTPNDLYARLATETGYADQTLRNAKCVCAAMGLSRRRDKLTFGHAAEIVGRTTDGQFDYWVRRVTDESLSVKRLREELRKATASVKIEPHDTGTTTFLEVTRQYARDFLAFAESPKWTPAYKSEVLKVLAPVLRALG